MSDYEISNHSLIFSISVSPNYIFNESCPLDPKTFSERLRWAWMDAGLLIKEFADLVDVTEGTVIN